MTKSKKALHWVVMMALALVVTLTNSVAASEGPIDWINRQADKVDKVKDEAEDLAEGAEALLKYKDHCEFFARGIGPRDLLGRGASSYPQHSLAIFLFTAIVFLGVSRILVWRKKGTKVAYWVTLVVAYVVGVIGGFFFEMHRSHPPYQKAFNGILVVAGVLLALVLLTYVNFLLAFIKATAVKEVFYFRQTWKLPPWITGEAVVPTPKEEEAEEETEDEAEAETEAPAPEEAPTSELTAPPVAPPELSDGLVICPTCTGRTRPLKKCGQCGADLLQTKPCPICGNPMKPQAKFCGFCGKSPGESPPPPATTRKKDPPKAEPPKAPSKPWKRSF